MESLKITKSSNLDRIDYDPAELRLIVQFKGSGGRPGSGYEYAAVPVEVFDELRKAQMHSERTEGGEAIASVGKTFERLVKRAGYKYRKL